MRKSRLAFIREIETPAINLGKYLLLCSILFLAFWIRIQMVDQIPEGQFLGNDSYLYYWQAMMISVHLPAVALINKRCVISENENEHGGVVIVFDEDQQPAAAYYIPNIGWDNLAVRLYFRGDIPGIFVPVYPVDKDPTAEVKVWEIHYPPDIQANPKYLATEPKE